MYKITQPKSATGSLHSMHTHSKTPVILGSLHRVHTHSKTPVTMVSAPAILSAAT
jgi:hypothetical protein